MSITKTTLLILPTLLLFGCSNKPEDAVTGMYKALKEGNFVEFTKQTKDPISRTISVGALATCSVDKTSYKEGDFKLMDDCLSEMYSNIFVKEIHIKKIADNKAYATVVIEKNSKEETHKLRLLKIDYTWKVIMRDKKF